MPLPREPDDLPSAGTPPSAAGRALVPAPAPAPGGDAARPNGAPVPDALAAELGELTRTLDLVATLVASASDRVDGQTAALTRLNGTVAEARQAAFAARAQSDPAKFAAEVEKALNATLRPHLRELIGAVAEVSRTAGAHHDVGHLQGQVADLTRDMRRERERVRLWRARLPGVGLATLMVVLALLVLVPRFAVSHSLGCRLMGGEWRDWTASGDGTSCRFEWGASR